MPQAAVLALGVLFVLGVASLLLACVCLRRRAFAYAVASIGTLSLFFGIFWVSWAMLEKADYLATNTQFTNVTPDTLSVPFYVGLALVAIANMMVVVSRRKVRKLRSTRQRMGTTRD